MSLYQNGGTLPSEMDAVESMSGMLDQDPNMLNGLNMSDMIPMDLDLTLPPDADTTSFTPTATSQQPQPTVESNDGAYTLQQQDGGSMSVAGAGPLPTGFGVQPSQSSGSTLTEFTKRRNWSQRVLEELKDFLHILTPDGRILYVSPSCKFLTGHDPSQIQGKFIGEFIHPDDSGIFVREFNESIASGNPLRFFYRFRKADDSYAIFESHGHPHLSSEAIQFGPSPNSAGFCRGFFLMARPYPTKNAALLDSFLEHKIENERLTKRIAELKREEAEETEAQERQWKQRTEGQQSSMTPSESPADVALRSGNGENGQGNVTMGDGTNHPSTTPSASAYGGMPPPAKPGSASNALTRQNLDEALAASKPDSINDKMARYEGATHIETIEMLTGLRYRDGERSQGISTGDTSPALIKGDAGIVILADRDKGSGSGAGEKKKKIKVTDEYVCTDCGTLDSPEWRKGPAGPKTLCNACGLRWAKKEKKRQGVPPGPPGGTPAHPGMPASLPMGQSTGSSG
ncbi:MAG: blue light receptor [Bathelium mastoideum]|nr:MAG: blue light receptor [Bathelium mastoideum]